MFFKRKKQTEHKTSRKKLKVNSLDFRNYRYHVLDVHANE